MESCSSSSLASIDSGNRIVDVYLRTDEHTIELHKIELFGKSQYLEDWLSANKRIVVKCKESDIDHFRTVLDLLDLQTDGSYTDMLFEVKDTIGILKAAIKLECPQIIASCVDYLQAVPWTDAEMVEIYGQVSEMDEAQVEQILSRIKPVDSSVMSSVLLSAFRLTTLSLPPALDGLKASVQKLLEKYVLKDDDPLVTFDEVTKKAVLPLVDQLVSRFSHCLDSFLEDGKTERLVSLITDMSCAFQILEKFKSLRSIVCFWLENSERIASALSNVQPNDEMIQMNLKAFGLTAKILQAVGNGSVILSIATRLGAVKVWLSFARKTKDSMDSITCNVSNGNGPGQEIYGEICRFLESAFNDVILTLPLGDQAVILIEWLNSDEKVEFPNLMNAFEGLCSRSKSAMNIESAWESLMPTEESFGLTELFECIA